MLPMTTKAGPGEKEPAYIVLKKHAIKFLLILLALATLVLLKFYGNAIDIGRLQHSAKAFAHNMKFTQNTMISSYARVGEEFERHLDRDIRELKLANDLLKSLNTRSEAYLENVTATIRFVMEEATAEAESPEVERALQALQTTLEHRSHETARMFLALVTDDVSSLVKPLIAEARKAQERRGELQEEIANTMKHKQHLDDSVDGDLDGDGFIEDIDGDGKAEAHLSDFTDDEWVAQTEMWHNETVVAFFRHVDRYVNDPNSSKISLKTTSPLYKELDKALHHLYDAQASWSDVQDMIHLRAKDLKSFGLPEYVDADPPSDDEFTGYQSWHVQAYIEDCLWPPRLFEALPRLQELRHEWQHKKTTALDAVGLLEEFASDNVVPHHWLHHGYGDDMYDAYHDDYF